MNIERPHCPVCEKGKLSPTFYADEFNHRGGTIRVEGLESYVCGECGAEPLFEDQIRRNDRRVADARRRADGLLSGKEIRALRKRLHLTQQEASRIFGGGANAFSKYERGDVIQSMAMDRLLRLAAILPYTMDYLRYLAGESYGSQRTTGYWTGGKVSMSDTNYRSRRIKGTVVFVDDEAWKASDRAA